MSFAHHYKKAFCGDLGTFSGVLLESAGKGFVPCSLLIKPLDLIKDTGVSMVSFEAWEN